MMPSGGYGMRRWAHLLRALRADGVWDAAVARRPRSSRVIPSFWWALGNTNFGDMLAPVVLAWVSGARPLWVSKRFEGKVIAVGSILGALERGDVVWGSGLAGRLELVQPEGSRILAVRGPLTRQCILGDVPDIYGDPACLLPRFHDHPVPKRWAVGLVPHHVDAECHKQSSDPQVTVIDVLRPWYEVVDEIRACEMIASSSLHGLIVAESYGVPARWIATPRIIGGTFKFRDYYLGTGREPPAPGSWSDTWAAMASKVPSAGTHDAEGLLMAWRSAQPLSL